MVECAFAETGGGERAFVQPQTPDPNGADEQHERDLASIAQAFASRLRVLAFVIEDA